MPSIFDPSLDFWEQRGSGPISPDPFRTGRICARAASRKNLWGPTPRRLPLLAPAQTRSRQERDVNLNRPGFGGVPKAIHKTR